MFVCQMALVTLLRMGGRVVWTDVEARRFRCVLVSLAGSLRGQLNDIVMTDNDGPVSSKFTSSQARRARWLSQRGSSLRALPPACRRAGEALRSK